jgi:RNA polymerase sigma-70 factor (ECF subfamily)
MPDSSAVDASPVYKAGEFEELYRTHLEAVFRYAWRAVGRRAIAEEITAEAFLELFRHAGRVRTNELPAWLIAVARNRAIDYWRRQAVERRYVQASAAESPTGAMPDEGRLFDSKVLKPVHRACLILRYAHGMDRVEIAEHTGLSRDSVKSALQYGRLLLRRQLLERGVKR